MTRKEAKKLKKIFKCIQNAYAEIDKATDDREADIEFVFGTSEKPNWAPESRIHIRESENVLELRLEDDGSIKFFQQDWVNVFGKKIYVILPSTRTNSKGKFVSSVRYGWVRNKFQYYITPLYYGSYYIKYTDSKNRIAITEQVLHYIINNFNIEKINEKVDELINSRVTKEFNLSSSKENYWISKKKKNTVLYSMIDSDEDSE
jgi:hypothetical protein